MCVCALVCAQLCLILYNPRDCSPPGSSVPGILQARILEWVAISSSRRSSQSRDGTHVSCISCIGRQILYLWVTREAFYTLKYIHRCMRAQSLESCLTLWDLMDRHLSSSSVHEILQERILEWVAMSFSRKYMHTLSQHPTSKKLP